MEVLGEREVNKLVFNHIKDELNNLTVKWNLNHSRDCFKENQFYEYFMDMGKIELT